MPDRTVSWFRLDLPGRKVPVRDLACRFVDCRSRKGLRLFAQTHVRAYGEEFREEDVDLYELDVQDGILDRDKTLTLLVEGEPTGCISYTLHKGPDGAEFILLANAGVPRELQGRGLGKELYTRLLNRLVDSFPEGTLVLADLHNGNEASRKIVVGLGFEEVAFEDWFPL